MKQKKTTKFLSRLLLFAIVGCTVSVSAQQQSLSGTVTDTNGQIVPGVNVVEKGTTNGTSTDFDGNYTLTISTQNATLIFSYIGFQTLEEPVNSRSSINVTISEDAQQLDEIVVIGYGTQKRKDVTGAVASLKAESFVDALPVAPEQLLQGKIAGVNIVQSSGQPGASSTVRIRGTSSISAGNEPLYVIDGVPLQFGSANIVLER